MGMPAQGGAQSSAASQQGGGDINSILASIFGQQQARPQQQSRYAQDMGLPKQTMSSQQMTPDQVFQSRVLPYIAQQQDADSFDDTPQPGQPIGDDPRNRLPTQPIAGPVRPQGKPGIDYPVLAQQYNDRRHRPGMVWNPFAGRFGTGKLVAGDPTVNEFGEKYSPIYLGAPKNNETDPEGLFGTWNASHTMYTPNPGRYVSPDDAEGMAKYRIKAPR